MILKYYFSWLRWKNSEMQKLEKQKRRKNVKSIFARKKQDFSNPFHKIFSMLSLGKQRDYDAITSVTVCSFNEM